jgi:hypothetical protein
MIWQRLLFKKMNLLASWLLKHAIDLVTGSHTINKPNKGLSRLPCSVSSVQNLI